MNNRITLDEANALEKRLGVWVWDALLYGRDAITNVTLTILGNKSGARLNRIIKERPDYLMYPLDVCRTCYGRRLIDKIQKRPDGLNERVHYRCRDCMPARQNF